MSKHKKVGPRVLLGHFITITVVCASLGLLSCGGGNSNSKSTGATKLGCTIASGCVQVTGGPIALSLVSSRVSGVAPLAVFFDATGTTDSSTPRPFHDLEYRWDFGDVGSGTWTTGSSVGVSSRNTATGPVAAHVFETPGTYTIALSIFNGTNTVSNNSVQITVTSPDAAFPNAATVCFFNSTVGTGCPSGATQTSTAAFDTALNSCIGTNKRCLFKKGDTFIASTASIINANGPGLIGAYGVGARPLIQGISVFSPQKNMSENNLGVLHDQNVFIVLSSSATPTISDWRIMDLEFDGQSAVDTMGIAADGGIDQVTVLRMNIHHMATTCVSLNDGILNSKNGGAAGPHHIWDQVAIVDSNLDSITGLGHINNYMSATQVMVLGNTLDTGTNEILRLPYVVKGVVSNNYMANSNKNHVVKIHAPDLTTPGAWYAIQTAGVTQYLVFSDNKVIGDNGAPTNPIAWPVSIGPQNNFHDERVLDVIYERNWHVGASTTQIAAIFWASEVTVRNNIVNMTGSLNYAGFSVTQRGIEPAPNNNRIYNNTFYSGDTTNSGKDIVGVVIGAAATNTTVRNNLGYAPNAAITHLISGTGASGLVASNNSSDADMRTFDPLFALASPLVPADFKLNAGSYAIDTGASVRVFSDFFGVSRPQNSVIDLGAVEQ